MKVVQEPLGDATAKMTLDACGHVLPLKDTDAVDRLGRCTWTRLAGLRQGL